VNDIRQKGLETTGLAEVAKQTGYATPTSTPFYRRLVAARLFKLLAPQGAELTKLALDYLKPDSEEAKAALLNYDWPGNVRELQNAVEHATVLGDNEWVAATDLPDRISGGLGLGSKLSGGGYHEAIKELKRRVILSAFNEANGSLSETARLLKLNPTYLSRLIKVLEIQLPSKARPIGK